MSLLHLFGTESNIWSKVITPASSTACLATLLCFFTFGSSLGHVLSKRYSALPRQSKVTLDSLLASTVHAFVVTPLTLYILVTGHMGTNRAVSSSALGTFVMHISFGYLMADTFICLYQPILRQATILIHHLTALIGIGLGLANDGVLMFFIVYRLISELSTPFLNTSILLYNLGSTSSLLFKVSAVCTMVTFFVCRILVIPWHWYEVFICLSMPSITLTGFYKCWLFFIYLVFDFLNISWFYSLIKASARV